MNYVNYVKYVKYVKYGTARNCSVSTEYTDWAQNTQTLRNCLFDLFVKPRNCALTPLKKVKCIRLCRNLPGRCDQAGLFSRLTAAYSD
jgi:hypothetical protein